MDGVVRRIGARSRWGRRRGGANATAPPAGRRGCPHRSRQRVAIDALAVFDENGPPRERAVAHHRVRTHREGEHRDGPGRSRRAWRAGGSAPKRERERGVVAREGSAFRVGTSETREGKKNRREGTATVEKRFEIRERRFRRLPRRRLAGPARRIAAAHIPPPRPAMAEACGVCAKPLAGRGAPRLTAGCCAARFHARCVSRRRFGAQVRPRPAPSAQPPPRPLRNPDPSPHSPPSRPPPNPTFLAPQPSCPTCGAPLREFTSDAVDADGTPSPLAPRRVRRERVVFHLLVDPARADATRRLCATSSTSRSTARSSSRAAANSAANRRRRRVRARRPHPLRRRAKSRREGAREPPRRAALILAAVAQHPRADPPTRVEPDREAGAARGRARGEARLVVGGDVRAVDAPGVDESVRACFGRGRRERRRRRDRSTPPEAAAATRGPRPRTAPVQVEARYRERRRYKPRSRSLSAR